MSEFAKRGRDFRSPSPPGQGPTSKRVCLELENAQFISGPALEHRKSSNAPELTMKTLDGVIPSGLTMEVKKATVRTSQCLYPG
jgi:hypothetical protein